MCRNQTIIDTMHKSRYLDTAQIVDKVRYVCDFTSSFHGCVLRGRASRPASTDGLSPTQATEIQTNMFCNIAILYIWSYLIILPSLGTDHKPGAPRPCSWPGFMPIIYYPRGVDPGGRGLRAATAGMSCTTSRPVASTTWGRFETNRF